MKISTSIVLAGALSTLSVNAEKTIDFTKDIQPIFQKSCVECHGPDKHKADLRLDQKDSALKGGKDGAVILPKDAAKSELYKRIILPPGSDDIMPSKGDPLTKEQTELIRDWINQGAVWPDNAVAKAPEAPAEKKLPDFKPGAEELKALPLLEKAGVAVRPIAMNVNWKEASFRALGTNANDTTLASIKDVASLVELNLAGTHITDAGLASLKNLTNLSRLHLEHTKVGDAGIAQLKPLANLAYLNLFDTGVTDAGLKNLTGLTSLRHLYVWQTKVTDAGVAELKAANPKLEIYRGWDASATNTVAKVETKAESKSEAKAETKPGKKGKKAKK